MVTSFTCYVDIRCHGYTHYALSKSALWSTFAGEREKCQRHQQTKLLIRHGCRIVRGSVRSGRVRTSDDCVKSCRMKSWCFLAQFDHVSSECELFRSPRSFYSPSTLQEYQRTSIYEIYCKGENLVNTRFLLPGSGILKFFFISAFSIFFSRCRYTLKHTR